MSRVFSILIVAVTIAMFATAGWLIFGNIKTSAAENFNEGIDMVNHQTDRMSNSMASTNAVVQVEISDITDIDLLLDRWTPRYNQAHASYERFDAAINIAEQQAEAYFESQRALTVLYHDEARRAKAEEHDAADYRLYSQWREQAHQVRANARRILNRLDDMNTDLQKLKLSADLQFDAMGFRDIPSEISNLEADLFKFQEASDNIRTITASPFADSQ